MQRVDAWAEYLLHWCGFRVCTLVHVCLQSVQSIPCCHVHKSVFWHGAGLLSRSECVFLLNCTTATVVFEDAPTALGVLVSASCIAVPLRYLLFVYFGVLTTGERGIRFLVSHALTAAACGVCIAFGVVLSRVRS